MKQETSKRKVAKKYGTKLTGAASGKPMTIRIANFEDFEVIDKYFGFNGNKSLTLAHAARAGLNLFKANPALYRELAVNID